ncbi:MAG TPA: VTT domain-containing protein [Syntrophorhabdaceae bacterium]
MVRTGRISGIQERALRKARSFVSLGHSFPFRHYTPLPVLFWPGCGISAASPRLVRQVRDFLAISLGERVGLALDCCGDPLYQLGDEVGAAELRDTVSVACNKAQVKRIITGCVNCQKTLSAALEDVQVDHVLTVIRHAGYSSGDGSRHLYLHHPCGASRLKDVREGAGGLLSSLGGPSISEAPRSMCCGHGGGVAAMDPGLADRFTARIAGEAGINTLVTYCMGCRGRFMEKGMEARHILELLPGISPLVENRLPGTGWAGRLLLSSREKIFNPRLLTAFLLVCLICFLWWLRSTGYFRPEGILVFLSDHPILAPAVFIGLYCLAPVLLIPAIPLSLAAGILWGPLWGVAFSITGATLGASVSFLLARYMVGDMVRKRWGEEKWESLTKMVATHGWKAVAIARLVPILPFNLLNYFFGITPIPFTRYFWCTFFFMLPGCVAYVVFASSLTDMVRGNVKGLLVGLAVAAAAFMVSFAFRPIVRKLFVDRS